MIERKKIVSSRIYLNLFHFHFLRPRGRKVIVDIQVTKFEIATVLQPLCTVSEVIGIIQRSQAGTFAISFVSSVQRILSFRYQLEIFVLFLNGQYTLAVFNITL